MQIALPAIDTRELRKVLGTFVTGVTVVTALDSDYKRVGLTANSFSSVSLDPPLVLWSLARTAPSHHMFLGARQFAISILADDQYGLSNQFARPSADKFTGVETVKGHGGVPLIAGAAAWIECDAEVNYPGGDHTIFLGRVRRFQHHERRPLAFGGGRYAVPAAHDLGAFDVDLAEAGLDQLQAVRMAREHAIDLADLLQTTVGIGVWGNQGPTLVHWEESSKPVSTRLRVGMVMPILGSATGLALAAHMPQALIQNQVAFELGSARSHPGSDVPRSQESITAMLSDVRRTGLCAMATPDRFTQMYGAETQAMSAPVLGASGKPILCLTVLAPRDDDASAQARRGQALLVSVRRLQERILQPGSAQL